MPILETTYDINMNRRKLFFKINAFLYAFMAYSLYHINRKVFSAVKTTMSKIWTPQDLNSTFYEFDQWNKHDLFSTSEEAGYFMGTLDMVFMIFFAIGLYISGSLGDRINMRKILAFGLISSSISIFFFGFISERFQIYNIYWYLVFYIITGLLQSTGRPIVISAIGNWFPKSKRGRIMGIWSASPLAGNMIGSYLAYLILPFGYEYVYLTTSLVGITGGIVIYYGFVVSPQEIGFPLEVDEAVGQPSITSSQETSNQNGPEQKAINFFKAFLIPGVIAYAIGFACLKFVNYSFFFWLPYYLHDVYNWTDTKSDFFSMFYDLGGIFGSLLAGLGSDWLGVRSPVVGLCLLLACPAMGAYYGSPNNHLINGLLLFLVGACIIGASIIISTAIAADIGQQGKLEAKATIIGIIEGTGSFGAAIGQLLIPRLRFTGGNWYLIFLIFIGMTFLTLLCILKIIWKDILLLREKYRSRYLHLQEETSPS
ncbi:SLC37A3 [Cordylochernes scorpioides]|uniref:Sugar phosphate exchanger 3 n=1 Tax=Cordylochernes scorpioides TaxID=51811 RepID=A0ABY6KP07_9ARAC|nr:SLC37A3 [Cordylochernes scorpioides]